MKNNTLGFIVAGFMMVSAYASHDYKMALDNAPIVNAINSNPSLLYTPVELPVIERVVSVDEAELDCMARNMYFEARNQGDDAMIAVGYVVMNRVASRSYKDSICGVVKKGRRDAKGNYIRNKCHFSWMCDGKPDNPILTNKAEAEAWERAHNIAVQVIMGDVDNPIGNAIMYHADYAKPSWRKAYNPIAQIEAHIFYEKDQS